MLTKLSTWYCLPLNHRRFLRSLSLSSAFVTVILPVELSLSSSARMLSTAVGGSSHMGVHVSKILSDPASILACILSILFGCQI